MIGGQCRRRRRRRTGSGVGDGKLGPEFSDRRINLTDVELIDLVMIRLNG